MDGEPKQSGSDSTRRGLYGQRPSKSADEARRREFEEIAAMPPQERMSLALELSGFTSLLSQATCSVKPLEYQRASARRHMERSDPSELVPVP